MYCTALYLPHTVHVGEGRGTGGQVSHQGVQHDLPPGVLHQVHAAHRGAEHVADGGVKAGRGEWRRLNCLIVVERFPSRRMKLILIDSINICLSRPCQQSCRNNFNLFQIVRTDYLSLCSVDRLGMLLSVRS